MIVEGKDGEPVEEPIKIVLTKLCSLFGLWRLEKHLTTLYQGNQSKLFIQNCDCVHSLGSGGWKYRKNSKNWDTFIITVIVLQM